MLYRLAPTAAIASVNCVTVKRSNLLTKRRLTPLFLLLSLLAVPSAHAQLPASDFFPIGVFSQPSSSFNKWKARGINSLFQYEAQNNSQGVATVSMAQWDTAATNAGLYFFQNPSSNPANDLQLKNLIAWTLPDEPDLSNHDPVPQNLIDKYNNLKAIAPNKPVWVNFAGDHITPTGANYTKWVKGGDWLSADWYPFNRGYYNDTAKTNNINFIGKELDYLRRDAAGAAKKYFAVIESSNQLLDGRSRAPTTDEFRGEIWEAIVHGATGLLYFPQQVPGTGSPAPAPGMPGGFQYDATPANLVTEMTTQNTRIASLGSILNTAYNPSTRAFSATDPDLESTWRITPQGEYFFVLNQSEFAASSATLNLTGVSSLYTVLEVVGENRYVTASNGVINDSFNPYAVHIYRAAPGITGQAVPEPASATILLLASATLLARRSRRTT